MSDLYIDLSEIAGRKLRGRLTHLVEAAATLLRDEIVTTMDPGPPRTGRQYRIPGTIDAAYTASAPAEPPAVREGRYRESWKVAPAVVQGDRVLSAAYTDLKADEAGKHVLGDLLEHGTILMAPRPHVRPAVESAKPKIRALIREATGG